MKIATSIAKTSVSSQLELKEHKTTQNNQTRRGNKQKIKPQIPKWKLKNQFKTFDDLLILIDKFGYLSDDEKNKNKFSNIRKHMQEEVQEKQSSAQQKQSNQQQTQTTSNQNQNASKNDDNNNKFPKKSKTKSESSKKTKLIIEKPTIEQLKQVENSQNDLIEDALQLEAFHFWISQIGCCRSPVFSLAPILSYYLYSALLFDPEGAQLLMIKDKQLQFFRMQLNDRKQLVSNIINYTKQKLKADQQGPLGLEDCQAFLSIIPQNINFQDIDFDTIIDDFTLYSQQYIDYLKKGDQNQQIGKLLIHHQNNVVLGYIRFNFINEATQNFTFRYPISQFDKDQCLDYFEIMEARKLQDKIKQDYKQLGNFASKKHYHSEMAMLLWLISDAIKDRTIFNQLQQSFSSKDINDSQLILKSIQLDITSKNKICDGCVIIFNTFPIKFYCEQMLINTQLKFQIKQELYLVINSQFFQAPQQKEGQSIYMDPIIIDVTNEQKESINEQQELEQQQQNNQQQQDFNLIQESNEQVAQDQNQIIQSQEIEGQQFVQQQQKIRYFVIQVEQEITGLVSNKMFDSRYRKNDIPIKKKIFEIPLVNTFFSSSCNDEDKSKLGLSSEGSQQKKEPKTLIQLKSEKSNKNRLFCDLEEINEFKKIKQIQLEKITQEKKLIESRRNIITSQELLIDNFKTKFFCSLAIHYCVQNENKNFFQFQIDQLNYLIEYVVLQTQVAGLNRNLFNQIQPCFTNFGIIFNEQIDKRLLLKDYLFFKERITPFVDKIQDIENAINNEMAIQLFQCDKSQKNWQKLNFDNKHSRIIINCEELFNVIKLSLQQIDQSNQFKYYLLICNLYEIDDRCKSHFIDSINNDNFIQKLDLNIHFESINLIIDKKRQKRQNNLIYQSQMDIKFKKQNLLNIENFMKRYQLQNDFERKSFNDYKQELIENFSCFNCQNHDRHILQQNLMNQQE